jgi:hypothetical protein
MRVYYSVRLHAQVGRLLRDPALGSMRRAFNVLIKSLLRRKAGAHDIQDMDHINDILEADTMLAERIDNLDLAERLGLLKCADEWMTMRSLGKQMVHAYVEDPVVLANALQTGHAKRAHAFVPALVATAGKMSAEIERRAGCIRRRCVASDARLARATL